MFRHNVCLLYTSLIIAAIALIILLVIPQLADAIGVLVKEIPSAVSQLSLIHIFL